VFYGFWAKVRKFATDASRIVAREPFAHFAEVRAII
jgi:hypothetical protein